MPTGKEIMEGAIALLNDEDNTRWPLTELRDHINEGVKATVLAKPSAYSSSRQISLIEGTLQSVPTSGSPTPLSLLDVKRNIVTASPLVVGRAISPTSRNMLDAQEPDWHNNSYVRFRKEVRHFTYDERAPLEFYVYPGNDGTGIVEALTADLPALLAASGDVTSLDSYSGSIGLGELYTVPLVDYVLHKAFLKDDLQGNPARSTFHYQKFAAAVGLKIEIERTRSPNQRRGGN